MARYIDADALLRKMRNTSRYFYIKYDIEEMPTADVAPKSEVENYKQVAEYQQKLAMDRYFEIKRLEEEIETLKDNNEHLAVMLEEAKQEADVLAEEQSDLIVEKDQLFDIAEKQKLEIESLKIANEKMYSAIEATKTELAREIFEEIEKYVEVALMNGHIETPILCIGHSTFAELKKKYTEET